MSYTIILSLSLFLGMSVPCIAQPVEGPTKAKVEDSWRPPSEGVVRDAKAAITIAHAIWISMHPNLSKRAGTEEVWQSVMTADLKQGIWEVTSKPSADGIGGALFIYIAKSDARVVGIVLTQ